MDVIILIGDFLLRLSQNQTLLSFAEKYADTVHAHKVSIYITSFSILLIATSITRVKMMIANGMLNKHLANLASERPRILNEGQAKHILVVGDSTAYGTGADKVEDTLTGRFAHDFPQVEVNNYAVNGSITKDVLTQLEQAEKYTYNLCIISTGGNDTWKLTRKKEIEKNLRLVLTKAKEIAGNNVVVIVYNNIASGPVFPLLVRPFMLSRTRMVNEIYTRIPAEFGLESVPIFHEGEKCPTNFFSHDGLHPSSEGYRIMYIRLWSVLYRRMYDFKLRDY